MKVWTLIAIGILRGALAAAQTQPGHTGSLPSPAPHHSIDGTVVGPPPLLLFCDLPEQVSVTAQARAESCATADYAKLYDAALADSARLDAWPVCPEECRPARRFMVEQKWDCFENEARVELTWVLLCSKDVRPPREMERPSAAAFKEPMRYAREGRWRPTVPRAIVEDATSDALECPSNRFVGFTYEEDTGSCDKVDFAPAIRRADAEAHRWYDSLKCPEKCEKTPWTLVYKEWKCIEGWKPVIRVEYLLSLACRK